jgi:hypothetical protein
MFVIAPKRFPGTGFRAQPCESALCKERRNLTGQIAKTHLTTTMSGQIRHQQTRRDQNRHRSAKIGEDQQGSAKVGDDFDGKSASGQFPMLTEEHGPRPGGRTKNPARASNAVPGGHAWQGFRSIAAVWRPLSSAERSFSCERWNGIDRQKSAAILIDRR